MQQNRTLAKSANHLEREFGGSERAKDDSDDRWSELYITDKENVRNYQMSIDLV